MTDVLTYLRAERVLAMVKAISFVTVDSVSFEKRTSLPSLSDETGGESQKLDETHSETLVPLISKFI
jgi:hypothetical protein